jgi:hypothetical protein
MFSRIEFLVNVYVEGKANKAMKYKSQVVYGDEKKNCCYKIRVGERVSDLDDVCMFV